MAEKMSDDEVATNLGALDGWSLVDGKLQREFKFANFVRAFAFMTAAAIEAEKMNHHPEWFNVYNKVKVQLMTHEADGITALDFKLAGKMDKLAG